MSWKKIKYIRASGGKIFLETALYIILSFFSIIHIWLKNESRQFFLNIKKNEKIIVGKLQLWLHV